MNLLKVFDIVQWLVDGRTLRTDFRSSVRSLISVHIEIRVMVRRPWRPIVDHGPWSMVLYYP